MLHIQATVGYAHIDSQMQRRLQSHNQLVQFAIDESILQFDPDGQHNYSKRCPAAVSQQCLPVRRLADHIGRLLQQHIVSIDIEHVELLNITSILEHVPQFNSNHRTERIRQHHQLGIA